MSLLLCAATPACGGGPATLHDSASAEVPVTGDAGAPPAASAAAGSTTPNSGCRVPEQGCPCSNPDETIACHGPLVRDGDYVTCNGTRACVNGAWGPCWPTTFLPAGASARRH